ncbi:hypothetical protein QBC44DRAFT_49032 [Cladorrhinum sp. PSN332]|nr:hypothetical protein QBC44DRAFT_49032 [Cladorrhinum sp. PSN332]
MPRQATFSVVPETLAPQPDAAPQRAMTSKQAQKLYREKNRQPRMSKQEMRRWELAEQERIRKELEKDKQLNRARFLREKKKEKEKEKLQAKKKSGQPVAPPRPSQPMITAFTWKKVPEQKKEASPPPSPPSPPPACSPSPPPQEPEPEETEERATADHESKDQSLSRQEDPIPRLDDEFPISHHNANSVKETSQQEVQQEDKRLGSSAASLQGIALETLETRAEHNGSRDTGLPASLEQSVAGRDPDALVVSDEVSCFSVQRTKLTREGEQRTEQEAGQQSARQEHEQLVSSSSLFRESGTGRATEGEAGEISAVKESAQELGRGMQTGKGVKQKGPPKEDKTTWSQNRKTSTPVQQTPSRSPSDNKENKPPIISIPSTQAFNLEAEEIDWDCIMAGVEKTGNALSRAMPPPPRRLGQVTPRSVQVHPRKLNEPHRSYTSTLSRPPNHIRSSPNTRPLVEQKKVGNGVQKPKFLPPHLRTQPSRPRAHTPEPKAQPKGRISPEQAPPTSTQLFLLSNFDELFPSVSQEARELEMPVAKPPPKPTFKRPSSGSAFLKPGIPSKVVKPLQHARPAPAKPAHTRVFKPMKAAPAVELPFLSTQDLVMSTQDLREIKVPAGTPLRTGPPVFLKPKSQTPTFSQTGRPVAPGRQFLSKRR